jgi:hypothetical protein
MTQFNTAPLTDEEIQASQAKFLAEMDAQVVSVQGFTRGQLNEAFELVKDASNWKNAIDATIPASKAHMIPMIAEAIMFFAGSESSFTYKADGFRVRASGYYASVGA